MNLAYLRGPSKKTGNVVACLLQFYLRSPSKKSAAITAKMSIVIFGKREKSDCGRPKMKKVGSGNHNRQNHNIHNY